MEKDAFQKEKLAKAIDNKYKKIDKVVTTRTKQVEHEMEKNENEKWKVFFI